MHCVRGVELEVSSTRTRYALALYELEVKYIMGQGPNSLRSVSIPYGPPEPHGVGTLRSSLPDGGRCWPSVYCPSRSSIESPRARGSVLDNGGVVVASS